MNSKAKSYMAIANRYILTVVMLFICLQSATVFAEEKKTHIHIISSLGSKSFSEYFVALNNHLPADRFIITQSTHALEISDADIYIVAGYRAAEDVANNFKYSRVVYVLISSLQFSRIEADIIRNQQKYSVLHIDQPAERLIRVTSSILPEMKHYGVIFSKHNRINTNYLNTIAQSYGVKIHSSIINSAEESISAVNTLTDKSQLFLALPDNTVFNRGTIKNILLTSYYANMPIIGFSESFLRAGAYMAIYSTPAHYGIQTTAILMEQDKYIGKHVYTQRFIVEINPSIARSLGLPYYNKKELEKMFK